MRSIALESSPRGQLYFAYEARDALILTHQHITANPRAYNFRYNAVPPSLNSLMPSDVLGWVAFFMKAGCDKVAARALLKDPLARPEHFYSLFQIVPGAKHITWMRNARGMLWVLGQVIEDFEQQALAA